jgi:hypothetical protein
MEAGRKARGVEGPGEEIEVDPLQRTSGAETRDEGVKRARNGGPGRPVTSRIVFLCSFLSVFFKA